MKKVFEYLFPIGLMCMRVMEIVTKL